MHERRGFTLIEIILVVVIIAILAALVLPRITGSGEKASRAAAKAQISTFKGALGRFELDCGRFPETSEGLRALVERPPAFAENVPWKRYLDDRTIPKDPWGNDYVYSRHETADGDDYRLGSRGPDGKEGTDDDIGDTRQ